MSRWSGGLYTIRGQGGWKQMIMAANLRARHRRDKRRTGRSLFRKPSKNPTLNLTGTLKVRDSAGPCDGPQPEEQCSTAVNLVFDAWMPLMSL